MTNVSKPIENMFSWNKDDSSDSEIEEEKRCGHGHSHNAQVVNQVQDMNLNKLVSFRDVKSGATCDLDDI